MLAALFPLLGAALVILSSMAAGTILLRNLGIVLSRLENRALAFLTGAACVSLIVLTLAALHLIYTGVLCLVTAALVWFAYGKKRHVAWEPQPPAPRWLAALFLIVALPFFVLYLFNAWAPEASADGSTYHLGNVLTFARHHGLVPIRDLYGALPEGLEMLFLFAFMIGRHSAAALVHFAFLIVLPILVLSYARRFGFPKAGFLAALMVFASPVIGKDGVSAYTDVATAAAAFGVVYFVELWIEKKDDCFLILAGLLTGFAFSIKYTGFVVAAWALPLIVFNLWRKRRAPWRPFILFAAPCLVLIAPWLIKDAVYMHNPLSPFFNTLFPNPYISPRFEHEYTQSMADSAGTHNPIQLFPSYTLTGIGTDGFFGPLFALAPLGLISLRARQGRHLLLAALLFGLPVLSNQDARFLIPAAACFALAFAMSMAEVRYVAAALMLLAGFSCWPTIAARYSDRYAWQIQSPVPFAAAWHRRRMDAYLNRQLGPGYDMAKLINAKTPPGSRIFCFGCPPQAYMERESLTAYQSAIGNALQDMLWTPSDPLRQPVKRIVISFPRTTVRRIRVELTKAKPDEVWQVNEMRVFDSGRELPRSPAWKIDASPDPWEAPFAFDNNPVSRWSTEKPGSSEAFLEVSFDRATAVDSVVLDCAADGPEQLAVRVETAAGALSPPLNAAIRSLRVMPPGGMRLAAAGMLKRYGFDYLVISDDDYYSRDFRDNAAYWGIRPVARTGGNTLFHLE